MQSHVRTLKKPLLASIVIRIYLSCNVGYIPRPGSGRSCRKLSDVVSSALFGAACTELCITDQGKVCCICCMMFYGIFLAW